MATMAANIQSDGSVKNTAGAVPLDFQCVKESTGTYCITGVLSIAKEGWRVSIPRDDNDQPMFSIEIDESENSVLVTVKKDNKLLDIPEGRTLTLRFDVPDLTEEE